MPLSEAIPLQPMQILQHATRISTERTSMITKWFEHVVIQTVQEHLLNVPNISAIDQVKDDHQRASPELFLGNLVFQDGRLQRSPHLF